MENVKIFIIAWWLKVIWIELLINKIQRNVNFWSFSLMQTIILIMSIISCWIKCTSIMSMNRNKQNIIILLHNVLCTISMMHIPIENCYSLLFPFLLEIICTNRNIIINTKSIYCVFCAWMMSRRANNCESILPFSFH